VGVLEAWLRRYGVSIEEAAIYAALLIFLLGLTLPPIRRAIARAWHLMMLLSGQWDRKYSKWFVHSHREIYNVYLDETESLDLGATYVPLAIHAGASVDTSHLMATDVISSREYRRLIIVGDPGSGKSTLLQAYSVGILRTAYREQHRDLAKIAHTGEIPFLVPLRRLRPTGQTGGIADYITGELLAKQARIKNPHLYLRYLLARGRCLVMLDGLDGVHSLASRTRRGARCR
jgi:predicted NACHT family NTPase